MLSTRCLPWRRIRPLVVAAAFLAPASVGAQGTPAPRAGLSPQQVQGAVRSAREAIEQSRKKDDEPERRDVDRRQYVVGVEVVDLKQPPAPGPAEASASPPRDADREEGEAEARPSAPAAPRGGILALVTTYRYRDDVTIFATVDVATGKVVRMEEAAHLRSALSDEEYEDAQALARERSDPVKALFEKFGNKLSVYPQFSQFTVGDDPRIHRVVYLTYRVGTKDLSYPRPRIDLTTREVTTAAPEEFPQPRKPR
ncbi:hypothetical protein OJF2_21080 [Aquisphaera giovannonii]|uniref:PepSY domain-containing protein n=1 Tax=Aquisphaera giovannonii TaxID=406548 RepID=A0A5B9W080_9BACT|nr:hypothetical protein [Aquisphaera giovannonii]QEH33604.1 hypothetical protein OJF2_21080 [Aquisphaera giovannonii]